jgi:hypothetical protein
VATPILTLSSPHLLLLAMSPSESTADTTHRAGKDGSGVAHIHSSRGGRPGWVEEPSRQGKLSGAQRPDLCGWSSLGGHMGGRARFGHPPPHPLPLGAQIWGVGGVLVGCRQWICALDGRSSHAGSFRRPIGAAVVARPLEWLQCATGIQQAEARPSSWQRSGPLGWGCDVCCRPAAGSSFEGW